MSGRSDASKSPCEADFSTPYDTRNGSTSVTSQDRKTVSGIFSPPPSTFSGPVDDLTQKTSYTGKNSDESASRAAQEGNANPVLYALPSQGPPTTTASSPPMYSPLRKSEQRLGEYAIGKTVGRGSFGKVKLGRHLPTNEPVAIKILSHDKLKSANMDQKIFREIKILRLFSHPNICRLYDVIYTPSDIFLIMEYVEKGELYNYIAEKDGVSELEARYIFQQLICAIEYCHHFRVVHRDLKPENILLGEGLQVKLIDFGLSNIMQDGQFLATSCGSPNYAAPEVISGKLYAGPELDVWSCGVILYALLCGSLPFDEETIPLLFAKIKKGKFKIPSHLSKPVADLIMQLLCVDPLQRLTIPQIRDNAWFNVNLPRRLMYRQSIAYLGNPCGQRRIQASIVREVARRLQCREKEVYEHLRCESGPGYTAYHIFDDAQYRREVVKDYNELLKSENPPSIPTSFTSSTSTSSSYLSIHPEGEKVSDLEGSAARHATFLEEAAQYGVSSQSDSTAGCRSGRKKPTTCPSQSTGSHTPLQRGTPCGSLSLPLSSQPVAAVQVLNLGMLLSQSPTMEVLLARHNAAVTKDTYNRCQYIPASMVPGSTEDPLGGPFRSAGSSLPSRHSFGSNSLGRNSGFAPQGARESYVEKPFDARNYGVGPQQIGGQANGNVWSGGITKPCTLSPPASFNVPHNYASNPYRVNTFTNDSELPIGYQPFNQVQTHFSPSYQLSVPFSTYDQRNFDPLGKAGSTPSTLVGSVASTAMGYTPKEYQFIAEQNAGWRLGIMSNLQAEDLLATLYKVLKKADMEWKVLSPFQLIARTTSSTWQRMKLVLNFAESHSSFSSSKVGASQEGEPTGSSMLYADHSQTRVNYDTHQPQHCNTNTYLTPNNGETSGMVVENESGVLKTSAPISFAGKCSVPSSRDSLSPSPTPPNIRSPLKKHMEGKNILNLPKTLPTSSCSGELYASKDTLHCSPLERVQEEVQLRISTFRIHEKHESGYIVDFAVLNNFLCGMDVVHCLATRMINEENELD